MSRIKTIICSITVFFFCTVLPAQSGWFSWGPPTLVTIGDDDYSTQNFKDWWANWQEEGMQFPETPTAFVEWNLLFKEAEKMKLYEAPAYRYKTRTFLKARTLMRLKSEEVDQKIQVTDDALWELYLDSYAPLYQLNIFFFKEEEGATDFKDTLSDKPLSDEEFAGMAETKGGYYAKRIEWYRPVTINPGWLPILNKLEKGDLSPPVPWKEGFVVLRLQDRQEGTREDMESIRESIHKKIWKKEETRLTIELLKNLREQYEVRIDTDRLEQLDITIPDDELSDEPLIYTSHGNISEKIVVGKLKQLHQFRRKNGFSEDTSFQFKNQVVNGIIDQTLTSWEGVARGYETRPPFKAIYQFYRQHQMVKLLEARLFATDMVISEEEIEAYYNANIKFFSRPEVIRMVIVEGSEDGLNSLWLEVALGGDFRLLAQKRTGQDIPIRDLPVDHINKTVKEVLDKLTVNEVSDVFSVDGHITLVQLIERKPAQIQPLSEVRESIRTTLQAAKSQKLRRDYLEKLKKEYKVKINDSVWQNLKEELEQVDENH